MIVKKNKAESRDLSRKRHILVLFLIIVLVFFSFYLYVVFFSTLDNYEVKHGYFISNDGDDSNRGTSHSQAWRTKSKLNSELAPGGCIRDGDDIYFRRGDTFDESVSINLRKTDGTASDPMIIGAYGEGADPIISTNGPTGIYFLKGGTGYWIIENLSFVGPIYHIAGNTGDKYNLTIRNCTFNGNNPGANYVKGSIMLYNVHNYIIENCNLIDTGHYLYGDGVGSKPNSNTIMRHCTIDAQGGSQDNYQLHCKYRDNSGNAENHLIYDVISINTASNAFDIVGGWYTPYSCDNVYIKDCVGKAVGKNAPIVIGHGVSNVTVDNCYFEGALYLTRSNDTIVRNCVFKKNDGGYIISQDDPQWDFGWGTQNCTIYNNDFIVGNTTRFIHTNVGWTGSGNLSGFKFKNNIFYSTQFSFPDVFVNYDPKGSGINNLRNTDSNFSYNIWWRGDADFSGDRWQLEGLNLSFPEWLAQAEVHNDLIGNASMSNPTGDNFPSDFELNSNSSAIDAGEWLTKTIGAGYSTKWVTVDDANYFFPGISALGVSGDNIFVGDDTDLEVIDVNYQNESIKVNRAIDWSDNEIVSLSGYHGSAPDIGAFEFVFKE